MSFPEHIPTCPDGCATIHDATGSARSQRKKWIVATLSAGLLIALLVVTRMRPAGVQTSERPSGNALNDDIAKLISAAESGNDAAYRACFVDEKTETGRQTDSNAPAAVFVRDLRVHRSELTGHVISDLKQSGDSSASLVLELVYLRENVRYAMELRQIDGRWKVADLKPLNRFRPEIPYGTPVVPNDDGAGR